MKKRDLIEKVISEFQLKPGKAAKVVDLILEKLLESSTSEEGFSSPIFNIKVSQREAKTISTEEGSKEVPARKVAKLSAAKAYK